MHAIHPLSAPFIEGLKAQVLRYQRCTQCNRSQTLARYACQHCGAESLNWQEASGNATVRAATIVFRAPSDDFRALVPYTLVLAELDEGPRLMGHAHAGVQIGNRVKAEFFKHQDRTLVRFAPLA
jgi:uncharacterized OB-fold protein